MVRLSCTVQSVSCTAWSSPIASQSVSCTVLGGHHTVPTPGDIERDQHGATVTSQVSCPSHLTNYQTPSSSCQSTGSVMWLTEVGCVRGGLVSCPIFTRLEGKLQLVRWLADNHKECQHSPTLAQSLTLTDKDNVKKHSYYWFSCLVLSQYYEKQT